VVAILRVGVALALGRRVGEAVAVAVASGASFVDGRGSSDDDLAATAMLVAVLVGVAAGCISRRITTGTESHAASQEKSSRKIRTAIRV
jgi:ABC-type phosphate transport system permease subunit